MPYRSVSFYKLDRKKEAERMKGIIQQNSFRPVIKEQLGNLRGELYNFFERTWRFTLKKNKVM